MNKLKVGASVHLAIPPLAQAEYSDHLTLRAHWHQQWINSIQRRSYQVASQPYRLLASRIQRLMQKEWTLSRSHPLDDWMLRLNHINASVAKHLGKACELPEQLTAHHALRLISLKRRCEVKIA